jgi:hypothetical protein
VITLDKLLALFGIPIESPNDDLEIVIGQSSWFDEQAHSAAQALLENPQFRNWLVGEESCLLLADGSDEDHATASVSAMSLLCVSIIGTLTSNQRKNQVVIIHFFAGLHCDMGEGPKFMMRSLIMQVLLSLRSHRCLDLTFINNNGYLRDLMNRDWRSLAYTLCRLLQQFPSYMTVYCLIDGVSSFESTYLGFVGDMVAFVEEMRTIVWPRQMVGGVHYHVNPQDQRREGVSCNFKLLMTSANGTNVLHERVDQFSQYVALGSGYGASSYISDLSVQETIARIDSTQRRPSLAYRGWATWG